MPLNFISSFEKTIGKEKWTKNMHECYQVANYFNTGLKNIDTPLSNILLEYKVPITRILSLIPFNIFIPDIVVSEREFILKNYKKICSKLKVKKMNDWTQVGPENIVESIFSIGMPAYNDFEKKELWNLSSDEKPTKKQIEKRIKHISNEVVNNAKKRLEIFEYAPYTVE